MEVHLVFSRDVTGRWNLRGFCREFSLHDSRPPEVSRGQNSAIQGIAVLGKTAIDLFRLNASYRRSSSSISSTSHLWKTCSLNLTLTDEAQRYLIMDRAYEGDETRNLATDLGLIPVVPPKQNRKEPWEYDRETYKRRNQIERFFLRIKRFRRVFTRYDKLDIIFAGFILFVMIVDSIV